MSRYKKVVSKKMLQKESLQQMSINITFPALNEWVRFDLYNWIEIHYVIVRYEAALYFHDLTGAREQNSIIETVTKSNVANAVLLNNNGIPVLIGVWSSGGHSLPIPIITKSFSIARINSNPTFQIFYKNYNV